MNILGPDNLIFGVDDLDASIRYATDYGLTPRDVTASGGVFEALDGTCMTILRASDASLAAPIAASPNIREQIYGVADKATLEAIGAELSKDRNVRRAADGSLHSVDDDGYPIGFQVANRRAIPPQMVGVNCPGMPSGRPVNVIAAINDVTTRPISLSHVVLFTPDKVRAEKFYGERLGFRTVDVFSNVGPFLRPQGTNDHHTLFLIQAPMVGIQHFTFHVAGPNELLKAGWDFVNKGYTSHWGPGRHIFGSNYFWYFNSPFGGMMEYDADMDQHDDSWVPRVCDASADTSQTFLLEWTEKWSPGGGPPRH